MLVINSIKDIKIALNPLKLKEKTLGLVPTMGALHEGHISLIRNSCELNDITICSIFINPTQFNNPEDFEKYPSTIDDDLKLLELNGCDIVFIPSVDELYANKSFLKFDFGKLEVGMEGANRPGHFNGVGLIISKLFNIINPDTAFFGQKDFQQLAIIKQLVKDLSYNVKIHSCPTLRENNGLAMSSRNKRLSTDELIEASKIFKSLQLVKKLIEEGNAIGDIKNEIELFFSNSSIKLEYIEIVDEVSLIPIQTNSKQKGLAVCIAAFLGNVRLIDNIIL